MSLNKKDFDNLIKYRVDQAKEEISVVELLIRNNKLPDAVNRIYYGIFYSLLALGLKSGFETSKHQQLLGWFNKDFINTGKFDKKYGQILKNAYSNRLKGDYDSFTQFETDNVKLMFDEMKEFIEIIERFILST